MRFRADIDDVGLSSDKLFQSSLLLHTHSKQLIFDLRVLVTREN